SSAKWTLTGPLSFGRDFHTATLLLNEKVLVAAGNNTGYPWFTNLANAEVYDGGRGFSNSWRPQITSLISPINLGVGLAITGSQFRGMSGVSGGNNPDSPADYPLVQLRSIQSAET